MYALLSLSSFVFLSRSCALLAGFFRKLKSRGDADLLGEFLINRRHIVMAIAIEEEADHGGMGAMEREHDATHSAPVGTNSGNLDPHTIALHCCNNHRRRSGNIFP